MKHERIEAVIPLPPVLALALGARAAPRSAVEAIIERMIEALDRVDGDPDLELNGDEQEDSEALQHCIDERGRFYGYHLAPGDVDDDEEEVPLHPKYGTDQTIMLAAPPARAGAYDWNLNGWSR